MTGADAAELARLFLVFMPTAAAQQLSGDLYRSKAAAKDASLKDAFRQLNERLLAEPTAYTKGANACGNGNAR